MTKQSRLSFVIRVWSFGFSCEITMNLLALAMLPIGLLISLATAWRLIRVAREHGWLDHAGAERHKLHRGAVPNVGGVAIMWGIGAPLLMILLATWWLSPQQIAAISPSLGEHWPGLENTAWLGWNLLLSLIVLHAVGLADDRINLGPWVKLLAQVLVSLWLVLACELQVLSFLGGWWGSAGNNLSIALSVLWLVTVINAMNFLDNMDGLSAGVAAIIAATMLGAALAGGQWFVAAIAALVLGATLGFAAFNLPPAKLFMGDCGSLVLGLALGFISIRLTYVNMDAPPEVVSGGLLQYLPLTAPLWWLSTPIYDAVVVSVIRMTHGASPMRGDHNHLSHRLVRMRLSKPAAVMTIHGLTALTCLGGALIGSSTPSITLAGVTITGATLLTLVVIDLAYGTVQMSAES